MVQWRDGSKEGTPHMVYLMEGTPNMVLLMEGTPNMVRGGGGLEQWKVTPRNSGKL